MNSNPNRDDDENDGSETPPFCPGCAHNEFQVLTKRPVNSPRVLELLVCDKCKTVLGVVPPAVDHLDAMIEELSKKIDSLQNR